MLKGFLKSNTLYHSNLTLLQLIHTFDTVCCIHNQTPCRLQSITADERLSPFQLLYPLLDFKDVLKKLTNCLEDLYSGKNILDFSLPKNLLEAYNKQIQTFLQDRSLIYNDIESCHGKKPIQLSEGDVIFFKKNSKWKIGFIERIFDDNMVLINYICNTTKKRVSETTHIRKLKYFFTPTEHSA